MVSVARIVAYPSFDNWDQVLHSARDRNVRCMELSNDQFMKDLVVVRSIAHRHFFKPTNFDLIHWWLNGVAQFDGSELQKNIHYGFVHEIHRLAIQIEELNKLPGSRRLIRAGIFSHFGLYTQFQVVIWLSKNLKIIDQEKFTSGVDGKKVDIDIMTEVNGKAVSIQVKDVREEARQSRQEEAIMVIDSVLSDRARRLNLDCTLWLKVFNGVPPDGISQKYWEQFALGMDYKEGTHTITFPAFQGKNYEPVKIRMKFAYRSFSGTFQRSARGFDNTKRLEYEFNKFNDSIVSKDGMAYLLVVISGDKYDWLEMSRGIANEKSGIVVLDIAGNETVQRSLFIFPTKDMDIGGTLETLVPEWVEI
ncbi:MAG: hypothetical protein UX84_C0026G0005 [Microgenomates group bacterium GW2011_GWD1_47_13]|nr:MAG: hypothetical protein US97_C0024G0002 [Microgenomates group bacterium GW2011_GWF1_38_5]KKU27376.1 MAG: hypothetical protein UX40_C0019G0006 [Microgenomates group bacterium GW2011_GWF2_46_18]KKU60463.1 MAG: hypothetical protein UX84_C0026G0005 [Microgenomates group bacterium GW2011_GWD1_47_13]OGD70325.1 MAG: hypothetical protein A2187_01275 [Candidatus Collierbacteria bacterium RIFOXYA1_FULL_46_24]HBD02584.1 hypothetical protein [Candidatus Collierbacteria bacterium]